MEIMEAPDEVEIWPSTSATSYGASSLASSTPPPVHAAEHNGGTAAAARQDPPGQLGTVAPTAPYDAPQAVTASMPIATDARNPV